MGTICHFSSVLDRPVWVTVYLMRILAGVSSQAGKNAYPANK
jgi:hypothetical protein